MSSGAEAAGAAAAAAAAAAVARAIKAWGAIVGVDSNDFLTLLEREGTPLVVYTTGGLFKTNHQYLTSYRGLVFFTKSDEPLSLPGSTELLRARKIRIPR